MKDTILFGDCKETLSAFLPQSARTCVTSPPYYGLRDYGTATWIGETLIENIERQVSKVLIVSQDIRITMTWEV